MICCVVMMVLLAWANTIYGNDLANGTLTSFDIGFNASTQRERAYGS